MKLSKIILGSLLVVLLTAACYKPRTPIPGRATRTPSTAYLPTAAVATLRPTSTAVPQGIADPTWNRVQASRKLRVGTSADYPPFEYYDSNFQIAGFDAAIVRELGVRLGLQVEIVDMPFEGLGTALQYGQVDAAIAAISITPERQSVVDFTNVYYAGKDGILARQGSGIGQIVTPLQLASYRIGVQRGSIYQEWLQKRLVNTGYLPASNLLAYEKPEHAVRDLKDNRNDLVVMDYVPAEEYLLTGGLEIIGQGLNTQLFAIAVPKGAPFLLGMLNQKLLEMSNDGTLARYAMQYLQVDLSKIPPVSTPTPLPPAMIPTPTPAPCYDGMQFVGDVTVPDGTQMIPGQDFDKIWRLKNIGSCTWDGNYKIIFVQGYQMEGKPEAVKGTVAPGQTYDMTIDQKAPPYPDNYLGIWQMVNGKNVPFGQRVWVKITVPGATPLPPTATVPPPVQPTLAPEPVIYSFTVNPALVGLGDLVVLNWSFSGGNVVSARLTRTDPDGTIVQLLGGADVPQIGSYEDLAMKPGTSSYTLLIGSEFGGTTGATVFVTVNP